MTTSHPHPVAVSEPVTPHETVPFEDHEHIARPQLRHHFETEEQQREAVSFGMWIFLLTEIMFFGGLFFAYLVYRNWYYPAFAVASHTLSAPEGALNTCLLIASAFTMSVAVWAAEVRKQAMLVLTLVATVVLGLAFLSIKFSEYHDKWEHHHVPGASFDISEFVHPPKDAHGQPVTPPLAPDMAQRTQVFFFLYFAMTGMHAVHMIIGLGLIGWLILRARRGDFNGGYTAPVVNISLYWHFVDIVWTFLFPLLYLVNRHL